jgi:uncharacterized membrane protein
MMSRVILIALAALVACGGEEQGVDTGSTCPPTDPPTYANFGAGLFTTYCLDCHSETKLGADRHDAPVTIDFDTRSLVRENTSRIDKQAAFGPAAKNRLMPPPDHDSQPTDEERVRLGQYIACEIGR